MLIYEDAGPGVGIFSNRDADGYLVIVRQVLHAGGEDETTWHLSPAQHALLVKALGSTIIDSSLIPSPGIDFDRVLVKALELLDPPPEKHLWHSWG